MAERPVYLPKEGFWITPDISISHDEVLSPGEQKIVRLFLDKGTKKLIRGVVNPRHIRPTVRSRYAHIGLDTNDQDSQNFGTMDLVSLVRANEEVEEAPFTLRNHSQRAVALKKGDPILRFFNNAPEAILKDEKLLEVIRSGKIKLTGEFGKDWDLGTDREGHISRILLKIKDGNRRWIPKSVTDEPVSIDPRTSGFRSAIEGLYVPVPETEDHVFHILETESDLTLSGDVEGVLSPAPLRSLEDPVGAPGFQTDSTFMDSFSDHHIRLEFVAPTAPGLRANAVSFKFLQNGY